jgi:hypothetical protein
MDKAIETDAKLLLVPNSGSDLLAMVSPSSPLAAAAVRSIQEFLERHGDGSKRLVPMLSHGLQEGDNIHTTHSIIIHARAHDCYKRRKVRSL